MKPKVIKSYKCVKTLESVYSGGQAEWSGGDIWSLHGGGVNIVREGAVVTRVEEEEDPVICFTLRPATVHQQAPCQHGGSLQRRHRVCDHRGR